jgi:hypothetical protein
MFEIRAPLLPSEILPRCRKRRRAALASQRDGIPALAEITPPTVNCRLLTASGLHWVLDLRGEIEAVVEYDARRPGLELVKVNSRVVCREGTFWGYNSHFRFTIPGTPATAELEVRATLWSAVTELRLRLDGITVFTCESTVESCSLPVPALTPAPNRAELPLPHRK